MKVLVTGGSGYIGSHVVVELYAAGHEAIIVDNLSNSERSALDGIAELIGHKPIFYEIDYRDTEKLSEIIREHGIDGVIHFAAFLAVGESVADPLKYYDNNTAGFIRLLQLLEPLGIPLVFSSSCTVYGVPETLPIDEQTPWQPPASPYGATKQMGEQILKDTTAASKQLKAIALRYFNPIGAHPSAAIGELPIGTPHHLVTVMTQAVAGLRDELVVLGDDYDTPDGSCIRDYIHVVDLAHAHIAALTHLQGQKSGHYDVFNIGTGHGNTVLEVIKTFEKATNKKVPYRIGERRPGDVPAVYADVSKATKTFGWQAKHSLEDALADAWRWQEKQGSKV